MNFIERVVARINGGDEEKLNKFKSDVEKYLKRQIKEIDNENEELNDKLSDAQDELTETSENVDINRIKTTDQRKSYIIEYIDNLEIKERKIIDIKTLIKRNNILKDLRKKQLDLLK